MRALSAPCRRHFLISRFCTSRGGRRRRFFRALSSDCYGTQLHSRPRCCICRGWVLVFLLLLFNKLSFLSQLSFVSLPLLCTVYKTVLRHHVLTCHEFSALALRFFEEMGRAHERNVLSSAASAR